MQNIRLVQHRGSANPLDEGWTLTATDVGREHTDVGPQAKGAESPEEAWRIAVPVAGETIYRYDAAGLYSAEHVNKAEEKGLRLRVRMRLIASSGEHGQGFEIGTSERRYCVSFSRRESDLIVHWYGGNPASVDLAGKAEGYHDFELTLAPDSRYAYLTVDGEPAGGPFAGVAAGEHGGRLIFGNNASAAFGTADYSLVQLDVAPDTEEWPQWEGPPPSENHVRGSDGQWPRAVVGVDNVCAWPNLTLLPDGTILAGIFNQPCHGLAEGDIECWASTDGGSSWTLRATVTQHQPETIRMNLAMGLAGNGDVVALVSGWASGDGGKTFRDRILEAWVCHSTDGGRTWTTTEAGSPGQTPAGAPGIPFGDILPGADGALRAAVYCVVSGGRNTCYVYRSDDDGRTWRSPVEIDPKGFINETALLHLGDGRWLAAARGNGIRLYTSDDDAHTWKDEGALTEPGAHPAHLMRLHDRRILLTFGNRNEPHGIDCRVSEDEGLTFSAPKRIGRFEGDGGYPASVQRADGQVVTAWYAGARVEHDGYHMPVAVWDPERSLCAPAEPGTDADVRGHGGI